MKAFLVLSILLTKFFIRPNFICSGGNKIFEGFAKEGCFTFLMPRVNELLAGHFFSHNANLLLGYPIHRESNNILCILSVDPLAMQ